MNTAQAIERISAVTSSPRMLALQRNKSWLFVFVDKSRKLHFYDAKFSPREAFERIAIRQPDYEMLDVVAFVSSEEATKLATNLRQAQEMLDYYTGLIPVV